MVVYSLVCTPPEWVLKIIKKYKLELYNLIGPYPSANSLAHVTLYTFECLESQEQRIREDLVKFCRNIYPFKVRFNSFETLGSGAFCIVPSKECLEDLVMLGKKTTCRFSNGHLTSFGKPHISIGRQLTELQLQLANIFFKEVNLEFMCDNITLRKHTGGNKQYEFIDSFEFKGKEGFPKQLSLF